MSEQCFEKGDTGIWGLYWDNGKLNGNYLLLRVLGSGWRGTVQSKGFGSSYTRMLGTAVPRLSLQKNSISVLLVIFAPVSVSGLLKE